MIEPRKHGRRRGAQRRGEDGKHAISTANLKSSENNVFSTPVETKEREVSVADARFVRLWRHNVQIMFRTFDSARVRLHVTRPP